MHNFLKIHAHLGVRLPRKAYFVEFTFSFFTQESVIVFLIAQPIRERLRAFVWVWRWRWWWKGYILNTCTYWTYTVCLAACLWLCMQVCAVLCSSCVFGDHLQLDNFITAHLVLFILITQAAKLRLRIQAFSELHSSAPSLSPSAFLTAAWLTSCYFFFFTLTMNTFQDNYGITLKIKLKAYCVFNNLD